MALHKRPPITTNRRELEFVRFQFIHFHLIQNTKLNYQEFIQYFCDGTYKRPEKYISPWTKAFWFLGLTKAHLWWSPFGRNYFTQGEPRGSCSALRCWKAWQLDVLAFELPGTETSPIDLLSCIGLLLLFPPFRRVSEFPSRLPSASALHS